LSDFKKTEKQKLAITILASAARYIMLFGGSRSGKTFITVFAIIVRACKIKSRHLIVRKHFNHAKTALWMDTLPKVLRVCFPSLRVEFKGQDYYVLFPNGSELWVGGLDDAERVEKILGKEYSTIYFNECSQMNYKAVSIALTRLAEKNDLVKKAYFDMNPPSKRHWTYWLFLKKLDPQDNVPVDPTKYVSLLMNPDDNIENIDQEYISEILDNLSETEKRRFKYGEFSTDDEGSAYYAFDRERHVREIPRDVLIGQRMIGMDFNVSPMTAVIAHYCNDKFYIFEEAFLGGSDNGSSDTFKMCDHLNRKGHKGADVYPDSTGKNRKTSGKSDHFILEENGYTVKRTRNPLVFDRVNNINRLFMENRIVISPECKKLINDLEKVCWKDGDLDQRTDKLLTHISDALGYMCWAIDPLVEKDDETQIIQL
jgi:PBSX family phage terminase large subunit